MQCINGVDEWRPGLPEGYFWGPFGGPIFESRTVSPDCRGTYFVTPFLGRIPAPLLEPALGQGRSARRCRCGEALRASCWSRRGGIGRGEDCLARALGLLCVLQERPCPFSGGAVLWARRGGGGGRVCAGMVGRGVAGRIAEQVVEGKDVAR